jgi:uncharacterized protein involved in response to NO
LKACPPIGVVIEQPQGYYYSSNWKFMKSVARDRFWKSFLFTVVLFAFRAVSLAQDSQGGSSSNTVKTTTTEHTEWYTAPWVWVVGGAVVILLLVALLSGRRSSSRTTISDAGTSRTIVTDSDDV